MTLMKKYLEALRSQGLAGLIVLLVTVSISVVEAAAIDRSDMNDDGVVDTLDGGAASENSPHGDAARQFHLADVLNGVARGDQQRLPSHGRSPMRVLDMLVELLLR